MNVISIMALIMTLARINVEKRMCFCFRLHRERTREAQEEESQRVCGSRRQTSQLEQRPGESQQREEKPQQGQEEPGRQELLAGPQEAQVRGRRSLSSSVGTFHWVYFAESSVSCEQLAPALFNLFIWSFPVIQPFSKANEEEKDL